MNDIKKIMGNRLLFLRTKLNKSQRELAKELKTSAKTICSWENGNNYIPTKFIFKICKEYDVDWSFFDPSGEPKGFFSTTK